MENAKLIAGDIGSMVFGWLAFHLCRYLLWLAPRTIVVANAHLATDPDRTAIHVPSRAATSRTLFVRCHFDTKSDSDE